MKAKLLALSFTCMLASSVHAVVISRWTFETSQPNTAGPISPEEGTGSASAVGLGTISSPAGNGSARSMSGNNWSVGDYWQFQLSTLGFGGITLSFDQTSSGTGPAAFTLAYSTGGSFVELESYSVGAATWSSGSTAAASHYSFDFSGVSALGNASTLTFRLINTSTTSANGGTIGSGGGNRIDNFTVNGNAIAAAGVPDTLPGGVAIAAMLSLLGLARRFGRR